MPRSFGPVIAERTLQVRRGTRRTDVRVRFAKPRKDRQDWACDVEITGLGRRSVRPAYGIDAVQALQLAQQAARARLIGRSISWLDLPVELAFPLVVPAVDPALTKRLESVLQRELVRWEKRMRLRERARRPKPAT